MYKESDYLYWEECINDLIERWHNGGGGDGKELHEFLGFSWDDYNIFCINPTLFYRSFILTKKYQF